MRSPGEIYLDIHSEESGGTLYRVKNENGVQFLYDYSEYDAERDDTRIFKKLFPDFESFWKHIKQKNPQWYYLHPLYVHPEQRDFIGRELKSANWSSQEGMKWQESHQRQWKKVLTDPPGYYEPPAQ